MSGDRGVFAPLGASNHTKEERQPEDLYVTDPKAVEALLAVEGFDRMIWEPCVGLGHISGVLEKHGHEVWKSDIVDRIGNERLDFLSCAENWDGDIITNPPYKYAQRFVEKALGCVGEGRKVAMLLKLLFLEGLERRKLFERTPPRRIWVFSKRVSCAKNGDFERCGNGAVCYAWFVWERNGSNGNDRPDKPNEPNAPRARTEVRWL